VFGMIEDRLGEAAFLDFMHVVQSHYRFKVMRVADFQRELEAYTGQSWDDFFKQWVYGAGLVDWSVESVKMGPVSPRPESARGACYTLRG
jgi:aminopeptidase N